MKKPLENIVGKGENAVFYPSQRKFQFLSHAYYWRLQMLSIWITPKLCRFQFGQLKIMLLSIWTTPKLCRFQFGQLQNYVAFNLDNSKIMSFGKGSNDPDKVHLF